MAFYSSNGCVCFTQVLYSPKVKRWHYGHDDTTSNEPVLVKAEYPEVQTEVMNENQRVLYFVRV